MTVHIATQAEPLQFRLRRIIHQSVKKRLLALALTPTSVRVSFKDSNGPKGGADKECLIRVDLQATAPIIVKSRGENLRKAFYVALKKLDLSLRRRVGRRKRGVKAGFGIGLAGSSGGDYR
ncbi:MAG: hypothetical protein KDD69_19185 [Bdellovibrionales bacterium]|nr:hypothetical protein [Bdellovibrionales bacterium]